MKKTKLIPIFLILLIFPLVFVQFGMAFEKVGTDNEITDSTDDVWHVVAKNEELQTVEQVSTHPYLDITKLSLTTSGENYVVTVTLKDDYNETAIEGETGSYIAVWISLNGSTQVNQESAPLSCFIGAQFQEGYVICILGEESYINTQAAQIIDNVVKWTFPQEEIKTVEPNTKVISEWAASAWSFSIIDYSQTGGESYQDLVGDPETEAGFQNASIGTSIPGYSPLILIGAISISGALLFVSKKYKKR